MLAQEWDFVGAGQNGCGARAGIRWCREEILLAEIGDSYGRRGGVLWCKEESVVGGSCLNKMLARIIYYVCSLTSEH